MTSAAVMGNAEGWNSLGKKVFWDRDVSLPRWRQGVAAGHRAYLPDSISTLTPVEFVRFYGLSNFKQDWPQLRAALPQPALRHASVYDLAWSHALSGSWNLAPQPDFFTVPPRQRLFLTEVARQPGASIYQIAKSLGLQYRRAHDHACTLIDAGKIRAIDTIESGRKKRKLYPLSLAKSQPQVLAP